MAVDRAFAFLTDPDNESPQVARRTASLGSVPEDFGYDTARDNFISASVQSLARRYGKKKKRIFRLTVATSRPPVRGSVGIGETPTEPPEDMP